MTHGTDWNVTHVDRDERRDPKFLDMVRPNGTFADHPLSCTCRECLADEADE